jgi:hypothetical protein
MITRIVKKDLQIWYKKYTVKEPDLGRITLLVEADNIYQVLFDYGIENTLILLEYFLHNQEFLDCAEIFRQIQAHNKLTGDNHPTILEDYYESIRRKGLSKKDL